MKLLVDTHVVVWWLLDSPQLSDETKDLLDTEALAYVSAVTPWELAVKQALGKLEGPPDLPERARDCQLKALPVTGLHGIRAGQLPPHHRDPFDRILIAQAQTEGLTLVTRDKHIPLYDVPVLTV
ncbi:MULTISPECIES: type II toxin-antitoxin system VapC family toxin [Streptomyces]|uniref:Type II toxin-antitoxin system VapC family toxin n=1 Tax=Streptomyces lateritius TaxID=67313 RepID=A0ABW6YM22_9ACTN|nr:MULTISPECIES: type II toxin-antitoxin system VapC family toxin [Streptomyces]QGZ49322.1 PIN domain-containing protein [Streptomyces sp. QHH-9511]GGU13940.1 twitching motility protein PilT [Streptomyces lateritius]